MHRHIVRAVLASVAVLNLPGCGGGSASAEPAGAPAPTAGNPSLITAAEFAASGSDGSAYDVIRRLRPSWYQARGATSMNSRSASGATKVSLDGSALQSLDALSQIQGSEIKEARYLNSTDAAQRYGTSSSGGAVIVITRR